jgi:cysteinyl-tRNA synthetase
MPAPNLQMKKYESVSGRPGTLISQDRLKELEASETLSDNDVEELIDIRNEARRQCNFAEADRIREILRKKGITLVDEKGARGKGTEVTTWRFFRE